MVPAETERRAVENPSQQAGITPQPATTFMTTLGPNVSRIMNSNGYVDTKGLGTKGGVLSYGDLNIRDEPMRDRKGIGSYGNPTPPPPSKGSFVRQTTNVRAVHPTTRPSTPSHQRPLQRASPVELAPVPPTRPSQRPLQRASPVELAPVPPTRSSQRPLRAAGPANPATAPQTTAETLADSATQSPYFVALLARADKRRTEQFPGDTDRETWLTVTNTIKVMWSAGRYTDAEAEHHLAQIISSSKQYASLHVRAWLGLDEDSGPSDSSPYPADLLGRLIDHFAKVMNTSNSDQEPDFLASLNTNGASTPPPAPQVAKVATEEEAIQESLKTARATTLVEEMMTAQGAVDPTLADAYLKSLDLCRIPVRGDGKCGMTVVALQSMGTGGPMDTDTALRSINEKIATLSAADRTKVFKTSRLYNPDMEGHGGEEEYFNELRTTTTDTYLDSGQVLVLALIDGEWERGSSST